MPGNGQSGLNRVSAKTAMTSVIHAICLLTIVDIVRGRVTPTPDFRHAFAAVRTEYFRLDRPGENVSTASPV